MDMLRFATAGSVDDGKSTLIGRLLYDSKSIFADQLEAVERASAAEGDDYVNLALLTDGLRAEREQGITIDVAYRYFATPRRKFIIADTPGHIQYTRNMVTGASTADLAIVLVDARKGLVEQSRRHAFLATLLRVPHLVLAVNKMDLVDYSAGGLRVDPDEFTALRHEARRPRPDGHPDLGAARATTSSPGRRTCPGTTGPSLLHHLEHVHVASDRNLVDVRFPVQYVIRPQSAACPDYRGYAGQVASGVLKPGDEVMVLPSGFTTTGSPPIETADGPVDEAFPPMSVTVRLDDEIDISRGDMICRPHNAPAVTQDLDAMVCWMDEKPPCRWAASSPSSTPRGRARCVNATAVPARRQHAAPRRGRPRRSGSTTSAGSGCAPPCRCSPTSTAATGPPAASSSSTRPPTAPSAPG